MTELIARRQFAPLYIWLDTAFLILFLVLLLWKKEYMTVAVGLVMGLVYLAVDYGIFHLICHSSSISQGYSLFWMPMSYGFTNFAWICLWMSRDEHLVEWSVLILSWWFCCPFLTQTLDRAVSPAAPEAFVFRPYRRRQSYGTLPLRKESYGIISEICAPSAGMAQAHAQRLLP